MDGLTINEAAETTGWSARMLRYIEREGLIAPRRSDAGYRLYGPGSSSVCAPSASCSTSTN